MDLDFTLQTRQLYEQASRILRQALSARPAPEPDRIPVPDDFREAFFRLVDQVNLRLMEDTDNFFGYFLFQMSRKIRFDISSPSAVNFQGAAYVLHFNPVIFLTLTPEQMETTLKHEILHVIAQHLIRARALKDSYNSLALNMAMDIVVNTHLEHLPPYATTLKWVNSYYSLELLPFEPFEYYAEKIQAALNLLKTVEDEGGDDSGEAADSSEPAYDPAKTHDLWEESGGIEEQTLQEFAEKYVTAACKGPVPDYLAGLISALKNVRGELPWNLILKRFMGSVESRRKKTVTRRSRRQPDRLDLRGQLRSHKPKIAVALDISGSISDAEFSQAIQEVLTIVKNYSHELTIIECDSEIQRIYQAKSAGDLRDRLNTRGGTRFSPVFEYANAQKVNLLVYFTDGQGEDQLRPLPRGYKTLWILSGKGSQLSLQDAHGPVRKLRPLESADTVLDRHDVEQGGYSMNNQEKTSI
ncbi:MAG TPA: VWA-like domain-containing protein [Patescibacteria group bacterium]|nr:VWA-like domain-containing protein [Patescibacteria group bacterium]